MTELCFETIFTEKNAHEIAHHIIDRIDKEGTLIDYDFHIKQGKFVSKDVNTWIRFDTEQDTLLKEMLSVLTDNTIEPTKERIEQFEEFRRTVQSLLSEKYNKQLSDKLRDKVFFGKMTENQCPMEEIKVIGFDLTDVPQSAKNVLVVEKEQKTEDLVPQSISHDLYTYMSELMDDNLTNEEITQQLNDYIKEQKSNNESKYMNVKSVRITRSFFECQIDLFVNYSMIR